MARKKYNSDRNKSSFKEVLDILKKYGYNPIAVAQMYFEDTFVFETSKEAKEAFDIFENRETRIVPDEDCVVGWWYGKESFLKTVAEYESKEGAYKVRTFWLKK